MQAMMVENADDADWRGLARVYADLRVTIGSDPL